MKCFFFSTICYCTIYSHHSHNQLGQEMKGSQIPPLFRWNHSRFYKHIVFIKKMYFSAYNQLFRISNRKDILKFFSYNALRTRQRTYLKIWLLLPSIFSMVKKVKKFSLRENIMECEQFVRDRLGNDEVRHQYHGNQWDKIVRKWHNSKQDNVLLRKQRHKTSTRSGDYHWWDSETLSEKFCTSLPKSHATTTWSSLRHVRSHSGVRTHSRYRRRRWKSFIEK